MHDKICQFAQIQFKFNNLLFQNRCPTMFDHCHKIQNIIIIYNYIHCYIASNQYGTIYKNQLETISILKKSKKYTPTDFQNTLHSIIFWHLQMRHSVAHPVCVTGEIVLDSIQQ